MYGSAASGGAPCNCCAPVPEMTDEQRVALERVRDAHAVLRSFLSLPHTDIPGPIYHDTYRQLTDELLEAVGDAQTAGVPEAVIFDNM